MVTRVLLVEDEDQLRGQLDELLMQHNYEVDSAADGLEGLFIGQKYTHDIGVIDLGLPKLSGIELIKQLRAEGKEFPILILTARGDWQDKVEGLQVGADDYLVKPFHVQELLARLNALIRRASGQLKTLLECGPVNLDTRSKSVKVNDRRVDLTAFEFRLLEYLMLHRGEVVSKTELTDHLYDQDFDRDSNVIEVFIGRLRRKLDPENQLKPIETMRGQGYRLAL
ncbi:MAG: response regulator transcription factor [Gammaproteobacteria bacterium]|nr:response regulator transcription factor [Gammaproteobacteria bacterium]